MSSSSSTSSSSSSSSSSSYPQITPLSSSSSKQNPNPNSNTDTSHPQNLEDDNQDYIDEMTANLHTLLSAPTTTTTATNVINLINSGASLSALIDGSNSLHVAFENEIVNFDVIQIILRCPNAAQVCSVLDYNRMSVLHHALSIPTPVSVIVNIIELFPEALTVKDVNNWLPLHFAVKNISCADTSEVVIPILLKLEPASAGVSIDVAGRAQFPIHLFSSTPYNSHRTFKLVMQLANLYPAALDLKIRSSVGNKANGCYPVSKRLLSREKRYTVLSCMSVVNKSTLKFGSNWEGVNSYGRALYECVVKGLSVQNECDKNTNLALSSSKILQTIISFTSLNDGSDYSVINEWDPVDENGVLCEKCIEGKEVILDYEKEEEFTDLNEGDYYGGGEDLQKKEEEYYENLKSNGGAGAGGLIKIDEGDNSDDDDDDDDDDDGRHHKRVKK